MNGSGEFLSTVKAAMISLMSYGGVSFAYLSGVIPSILWFISSVAAIVLTVITAWSIYSKTLIAINQERDRKLEIKIRKQNGLDVRRKDDSNY
jgi:hypothetical protein